MAATVKSARSRTATASAAGTTPELGPRLGGEDLDLQPGPEPGLVGEEAGDLRQCVALYQGGPSSCRTLYEPETVRTGPDRACPRGDRGEADGRGGRAGVMNCTKHWTEHAVAECDECGQPWCAVCLVPPPEGRRAAAVHPLLAGHRRGADPPPGALSRVRLGHVAGRRSAAAMSRRNCMPSHADLRRRVVGAGARDREVDAGGGDVEHAPAGGAAARRRRRARCRRGRR